TLHGGTSVEADMILRAQPSRGHCSDPGDPFRKAHGDRIETGLPARCCAGGTWAGERRAPLARRYFPESPERSQSRGMAMNSRCTKSFIATGLPAAKAGRRV